MSGVWDAHVHAYPPEVAEDPESWAATMDEPHWARLHASPLQGWSTLDTLLADMDAAGVERVVLQGWYWQRQATCRWHNEVHLRWRDAAPDRIIPFATVNFAAGAEAIDDLRAAVAAGCAGVGELFPSRQGFSIRLHPPWLEACAWLEENGLPLTLHATEAAGHDYAGRLETPLDDFVWLATRFPRLRIILAHWGGGLPFFAMNPRLRPALANVYFDSAASPLLYDGRVWRAVADLVGAHRILFGSDYPLRLYPRAQKAPGFRELLSEARASGLTEQELQAVLSDNLRLLLS